MNGVVRLPNPIALPLLAFDVCCGCGAEGTGAALVPVRLEHAKLSGELALTRALPHCSRCVLRAPKPRLRPMAVAAALAVPWVFSAAALTSLIARVFPAGHDPGLPMTCGFALSAVLWIAAGVQLVRRNRRGQQPGPPSVAVRDVEQEFVSERVRAVVLAFGSDVYAERLRRALAATTKAG